ncbi:uncharacterized protein LOC111618371 [Centruroides sculpturatus]|uniref:uncharacterized protein LOC111618371 n=1 Tax=Centruroides sculpturatus TaxID=218467 RepID=UPI000C6C93EC|nr:uncharacterized protein LOC111618371 [Centruroides sculpturatus]
MRQEEILWKLLLESKKMDSGQSYHSEILHIIQRAKDRKAFGPDNITADIVRGLWQRHPDLLFHLYNLCLSHGVFPIAWKRALFALIPKDKSLPPTTSNLRNISLLSALGKVLDKLLRNRLSLHLESIGYLHPSQFGFRRQRRTVDALMALTSKIISRKPPLDLHLRHIVYISHIRKGQDIIMNSTSCNEVTVYLSHNERDIPFTNLPHPAVTYGFETSFTVAADYTIFTDGSKNAEDTGSAFVVFANEEELYQNSGTLHPNCSIFQAELCAIYMAVQWCEANLTGSRVTIHSNSASAINAFRNPNNLYLLVRKILYLVLKTPIPSNG